MARIRELRAMTDTQLREQLDELQAELFNLRFQRAAYKNPSPARFGQIKRNVAQIKTILREREIEALIAEVEAATAAV
jgi:large subunit ribosomal protein L29